MAQKTTPLSESKLTLQQLEQFLWKSADILRGKIDSSDYKKYIFGLLFYKRISDIWDEEYQKVLSEFKDKTLAEADYNHRFQVPANCKWTVIQQTSENIGQKLNDVFDRLTNANSPKLDKIFDDLDFANKDRFPNEALQRLINHFSQYNFGSNYISSDVLGDAYEYLIKMFAADAGKKGGEFYTPREVERVIMGILKPHHKDHIYDMACGSGGFLLEAYNYLKQKSGEEIARSLYLYGQELNISTFAIAKINMFLHGLDSADIRRGDTLANPQFLNQDGSLQTFDICVANPPYSIKDYDFEVFNHDRYGRADGYDIPPNKNADYAFILHLVKSMNLNGRAGIVLPHGVLFRSGTEGRIREQLIKNDLIDAIISLPAKLFYGTGIPAAIWILNKNKSEERKNKIMIIDASKEYFEGKNQNFLRKLDIDKIIRTFDQYVDVEKYARLVDYNEVSSNGFNLNVNLYIDSSASKDVINVVDTWNKLNDLEQQRRELDEKVAKLVSDILARSSKNDKYKKVKLGSKKYEIPNHWRVTNIGETSFLKGRIGWQGLTTKEYLDTGDYYLVTGTDFRDGRIAWETCHFVEKERYDQDVNIQVKYQDVLVTKDGTIGKVAFIDKKPPKDATLNSGVFVLRPLGQDYLPEFMYWILQSNFFRSFINDIKAGSTISHLYQRDFNKFEFICPPIVEQKKIVEVLNFIERKLITSKEICQEINLLKEALTSELILGVNKSINI